MINEAGLALIRFYESFVAKAYICPAGVPTIGYGTTKGVTREDVRNGRTISIATAEALLREDVEVFERAVRQSLTRTATDNQLAAMVALAYNIGPAAFKSSSVLRFHNAGDFARAASAFSMWNKARNPTTGILQVLNGLTKRRAKEAELYLTQ